MACHRVVARVHAHRVTVRVHPWWHDVAELSKSMRHDVKTNAPPAGLAAKAGRNGLSPLRPAPPTAGLAAKAVIVVKTC